MPRFRLPRRRPDERDRVVLIGGYWDTTGRLGGLSDSAFRCYILGLCELADRTGACSTVSRNVLFMLAQLTTKNLCSSRRNWRRLEAELIEAELIARDEDDPSEYHLLEADLHVGTWRRGTIGYRLRGYIYERDGGICQLCGDPVDSNDYHIDHIRRVAQGGVTSAANLRLSHPACNLSRSRRASA